MASRDKTTRQSLGVSGNMLSAPEDPLAGLIGLANDVGDLENRQKLKRSFEDFFTTLFLDSKGHKIELQSFQKDIIDETATKKRLLLNLFRGSGKSTLITVAYCCWLVGNNRNLRIIIACKNESLAVGFLRQIDAILKSDGYKQVFGNLVPAPRTSTWNDTEKIVTGRAAWATGLTFFAIGAGAAAAGRRADLIVVDDCADAKNSSTEIQRKHLSTWFFEELEPVLEPDGTLIVVGTKWNPRDIYYEVNEAWEGRFGTSGFRYILQPVLHMVQTDEGTVPMSIWPNRYSTEMLLAWQEARPLEFAQQMLCDPVDTSLAFLQREWLDNNLIDEAQIPPEKERLYYFGVDPSWSRKETADFYAIAVGAKVGNTVYLTNLARGHADPDSSWKLVTNLASATWPQRVRMDTTAAQTFLKKKIEDNSMLIVDGVRLTRSKTDRFADMSSYFTSGRIKIAARRNADGDLEPLPCFDPLFYEWSVFRGEGSADHDDCLDATDLMIQAAIGNLEPVEGVISGREIEELVAQPLEPSCAGCGDTEKNLRHTSDGLYCGSCLARKLLDDPRGRRELALRRHFLGY